MFVHAFTLQALFEVQLAACKKFGYIWMDNVTRAVPTSLLRDACLEGQQSYCTGEISYLQR